MDQRSLMYLLRHGATPNNEANPPRLQGCRSNESLSAAGRAQAEQAAEVLSTVRLEAVYCSPLERARQTAQIVAGPHKLEPQAVEGLTECDVGSWEGRSWREIEEEDPEAFRNFIADSAANPYAGGESLDDVRRRVAPVFESLLARHPGERLAVVSHNVVNRVFLADCLGWPIAKARSIPQSNCGINLIEHHAGKSTVLTINSALHLR